MQTEELSYVIATPYSMRKSRTGGIVGRLISRTGLDLVGGRMFAPSSELAKRYAETIVTETDARHRATQELIHDYILKNFTGSINGQRPRVLFLIFRGPEAVEKIRGTVGHIVHERTSGETNNFKFPNLRPGGVIEVFSRSGLYIIGFKVHRMSVAQAEEFYGPVLAVLEKKLGAKSGRENWESIVEFMAGRKPSECPTEERDIPGSEKSIAIVYQGEDAVRKIRDVLGPTDPAKAPPGSIRREFGQTVMVNAAHASDSAENAKREMAIIDAEENNFKPLIENFYRRQ